MIRWLVAAVVLIAGAGLAWRLITDGRPPCQESAVPAYFYPGPNWTLAIDSKPAPRIMIMDITSSGAGRSPDRNYQTAVRRAQAAGITIAGYSTTSYARRPASSVEQDVRNYKAWYDVTDIFLDEVSSGSGRIGYYRRLAGYIHHLDPGSVVMLNPGTYPARQYMSVGDIVMVYEGSYASYAGARVPAWAGDYPAARFAQAIYATPGSRLASVISLAGRRHAGYVYVTDAAGSNPYGALPSYWSAEDAIIAARCSGSGATAARP